MTTKPMRIAMISEHASPLASVGGVDAGGQNIYVAHVARWLARMGHHVDVLTRRDNPDLPVIVDLQPGARVVHIDAGPASFVAKEQLLQYMPEFARGAERLMRHSVPYDLFHAHFFMSGWVAQQLRQALSVPFAITFHALGMVRLQHQGKSDAFPPERLDIERELVQEADALIAECPQDEADLTQLYGARGDRIRVVPCGFDPAEFAPMNKSAARAALGLDPGEFIVLQLGRQVPRKGIDNVIRSLAHLPTSIAARLLVVGGEGGSPAACDPAAASELERLRQVAGEHGVADRVVFTGHRERAQLRHFYAAADVFVTTPWYEPFGITPLEAMACGTPVIGSAVGGIKHSVVDGVTGFLVPSHDPAALADRLATLQANPDLARAMGRAGVARARSMFTWERVARELAEVYVGICRQRPVYQVSAAWTRLRPEAAPLVAHSS